MKRIERGAWGAGLGLDAAKARTEEAAAGTREVESSRLRRSAGI